MGRRLRGQIRRGERMGNRRARRLYAGPLVIFTVGEPWVFWRGAAVSAGHGTMEIVAVDRKAGTITCAPRPDWWLGSADYVFGGSR